MPGLGGERKFLINLISKRKVRAPLIDLSKACKVIKKYPNPNV